MPEKYFSLVDELFEAIEDKRDVNQVRKLIKSGCDVNVQVEEDYTPLIAAAIVGSLEIVKLLVELGADVNMITKYGDSPLYCAKSRNFQDIAEYLEPMTSAEIQAQVARDLNVELGLLKRKKKPFKSKQ